MTGAVRLVARAIHSGRRELGSLASSRFRKLVLTRAKQNALGGGAIPTPRTNLATPLAALAKSPPSEQALRLSG
jgi:hypothetical protein